MSDKSPKYYAYKASHPVATIHWAACPHCRFGQGQRQYSQGRTNLPGRGWRPLTGHDDVDVILLVESRLYRFCGTCCADLRDGVRKRAT
jgi:hypothetical protein